MLNIVGISGSLRQNSLNAMALRAVQRLAPTGMRIHIADIRGIPLYDDDIYRAGCPDQVTELKDQLRCADAVLLASPEYNFSIPGVLKNTLDWISRPPDPVLSRKPVAIIGASTGRLGTARAQYHLRQVLQCMNCVTVSRPEVFIGEADKKFNEQGQLKDKETELQIADLLAALRNLCANRN
ncbi:NAD(P)H-dependent oxidoreductase [Cupriavidus basilensis]|nr:NAD(P)H-dependent oxidoreductase [Cupriavidus basilensis]